MPYLRSLPLAEIKAASAKIFNYYNPSVRWPFQPAIDGPGGIIPEAPITLWQKGHFQKVPVLTGFCTDEGAPFVDPSISTSAQFTSFFDILIPALPAPDRATLNTLYPDPLTDPSSPYTDTRRLPGLGAEYKRLTAAYGQYAYIAPTRHTAYFTSATSGESEDGGCGCLMSQRQTQPPVYLYHFALNRSVLLGTGHACAAPYVTYSYSVRAISPDQKSLAAAVNDYWTSFVATGDPNAVVGKSPNRAFWPVYNAGAIGLSNGTIGGEKMVFGRGNDERAGGSNVGVLTQSMTETVAVKESIFWWEREILSEE
jgi:acetylcholinesterase